MFFFIQKVFAADQPTPAPWKQAIPGDPTRCVRDVGTVTDIATIQGLECLFQNVVTVVTALAGLALFVMLLIGGVSYLTSGGDPKASEKAKNTMTFAVGGLVLIIAAYLILNFISVFTGIPNLLKFTIPGP